MLDQLGQVKLKISFGGDQMKAYVDVLNTKHEIPIDFGLQQNKNIFSLCFLCDITGSMKPYIKSVKLKLQELCETIKTEAQKKDSVFQLRVNKK